MRRPIPSVATAVVLVAAVGVLSALLVGVVLPTRADAPWALTEPRGSVPIARLLAVPGDYGEKEVLVQGRVIQKTRAAFPNGRPYSTLLVGEGQGAITAFSWEDPPVERGDLVEVIGLFHLWRYNFRHMIESRQVTRLPTGLP